MGKVELAEFGLVVVLEASVWVVGHRRMRGLYLCIRRQVVSEKGGSHV